VSEERTSWDQILPSDYRTLPMLVRIQSPHGTQEVWAPTPDGGMEHIAAILRPKDNFAVTIHGFEGDTRYSPVDDDWQPIQFTAGDCVSIPGPDGKQQRVWVDAVDANGFWFDARLSRRTRFRYWLHRRLRGGKSQ
jgi:hypothetical protein